MPLLAGLVAALLASSPATPAGAIAPERIRDRAAEVLRAGDHQRALPETPKPAGSLPLDWAALLLRILVWAAVAVVVFLAAAWLAQALRGRARDPEGAPDRVGPAPVPIPIASAEALAADGRYAEAIHALLLETLEALSRAARLAPSLTSREIVARVPLAPPARAALAGLVAAVEVSRFGGAEAGADDYRACLERFEAFLATYRSAA